MRVCRVCGEEKPDDDFYDRSRQTCKPCVIERVRRYKDRHPRRAQARMGRPLVAQTCKVCGELKDANQFGKRPNTHNYDGTCRSCRYKNLVQSPQWPEIYQRDHARKLRRAAEETTRAEAQRANQLWTGPELELAMRKDLTARQVAAMIGRTTGAVEGMRYRINHDDPTTRRLVESHPLDSKEKRRNED